LASRLSSSGGRYEAEPEGAVRGVSGLIDRIARISWHGPAWLRYNLVAKELKQMPDPVHIHTRVDSETLTLPELRPFVGKSVEITVREDAPAARKPDWKRLRTLAEMIDFDEESEKAFWELQRISTI